MCQLVTPSSSVPSAPGLADAAQMLSMPSTLVVAQQLKLRLNQVYDEEQKKVIDRDELARIVAELASLNITTADLEKTRLGRQINEIRQNVDKVLGKQMRELVKKWRSIAQLDSRNSATNNSNSQANSPPGILVSPSSGQSNDSQSIQFSTGVGTPVEKENNAAQHKALLRVREQITPLTSPGKDSSLVRLVSPSSASNLSPAKKLSANGLYSRSANASPQMNGHLAKGKLTSPAVRNSFSNILGSSVSPALSSVGRVATPGSNVSSRNCSPALSHSYIARGGDSDNSNSNSHFRTSQLPDIHEEDSVGSNLSNHFSRFGRTESEVPETMKLENSKKGRKRKVEVDTLRENLNSVLNSASGRKAQSTAEIFQNCMKKNPLSSQSSPALPGIINNIQPAAKKPRISTIQPAYIDDNAVQDFETAMHPTNGFPVEATDYKNDESSVDSYESASNRAPYKFHTRDRTFEKELAEITRKLPKLTQEDFEAVRDFKFVTSEDLEVPQASSEDSEEKAPAEVLTKNEWIDLKGTPEDDEYVHFVIQEPYESETEEEVDVTDDGSDVQSLVSETPEEMEVEENLTQNETQKEISEQTELPDIYSTPGLYSEDFFNPKDFLEDFENEPYIPAANDFELSLNLPIMQFESSQSWPKPIQGPQLETREKRKLRELEERWQKSAETFYSASTQINQAIEEAISSKRTGRLVSRRYADDDDDDDDDLVSDDETADSPDGPESIEDEDETKKKLIDDEVLPTKKTKKIRKKVTKIKFRPKVVRSTVRKDEVSRLADDHLPEMNGCYDQEGQWCDTNEVVWCAPLKPEEDCRDELDKEFNSEFYILPYTQID